MENRKQKEENEMEIDLVSLFFYLIDKWKLLFLGAVVGVVLAGHWCFSRHRCTNRTQPCMCCPKQPALHLWQICR